jgi:hypothetical protein
MRLSPYFKTISQILILAMLNLCWLTSYGWAEMLPTDSTAQSQAQDNRQRVLDLISHQEVVDEFEKYGISKVKATARINSLTDEEVSEIAGRLGELPEGGFSFGPSCTKVNGRPVSGCDSPDAGAVLAVIGILVLIVLLIYWIFSRNKAEVYSPPSKERSASEPVFEEACDPGMESCTW